MAMGFRAKNSHKENVAPNKSSKTHFLNRWDQLRTACTMSAKVKKMGSSWFTNKKATLLSVLTIAGWSLLLGPQLQAKVEVAKQYCARQYHLWQSPVTDDGVIEIIGDGIPACEHPGYLPRIISYDPFIMHIENFVSEAERAYLIELGYLTPFLAHYAAY